MKKNESNAKHSVQCDACMAEIGELYPNNKDNISVPLKNISKTNNGDSQTSYSDDFTTKHYCNESCLASDLQSRAKILAKMKKSKASLSQEGNVLELDITCDPTYLSKKNKQ